MAPFRDLHEFVAACEQRGWLKRIKTKVSPYLEIAEITDRVSKMPGGGYALLFENVEGSQFPVLTNAFGSMERMCLALGVPNLDALGDRIRDLMKLPGPGGGLLDKLGQGMKLLDTLKSTQPRMVSKAPCQEVVMTEPDLTKLPVLTTWPQDGGPFITMTNVITRDPQTGARNIGMYRLQVYDKQTTGMHWHKHKDGQRHYDASQGTRMPVAVALGGDPVTMYSGSCPLPPIIPELMFSGFVRGEGVELVKCKTIDLEVPAHADFILEGYVDTTEPLRLEGPFGDHTGFYSPKDLYPVFHITCITHRRDAIYPATVVGKPPQEDVYLGKATERIFLPILQMAVPEVVDYNIPAAGTFHNCVLVKIRKRYPGQARKVIHALWGLGLMMLSKTIVVVDEHIDLNNYSEVFWYATANIDPKRDIFFTEGPADDLEHASPAWRYGSKMGIDATRKFPEEGHPRPWPDEVEMSPEVKEMVTRRWAQYGLPELGNH
mgnify:CR=1 FL=1